jgi:hypothetical protein
VNSLSILLSKVFALLTCISLDVFAGPNLTPHADPILTPYLS